MNSSQQRQKETWEEQGRRKANIRIAFQKSAVAAFVWQTCLNCEHWRKKGEPGCTKFNAMPPPHIIVTGCEDHEFDIPF